MHHRDHADLGFLNSVAKIARRDRPELTVLLTTGDRLGEGLFLLVGPEAHVAAAKEVVSTLLGARGGGPPGRFQGKATHLDKLEDALAVLSSISAD